MLKAKPLLSLAHTTDGPARGAGLGQHHQRARAFWIIENARHLSTALLDDLEDNKVALMRALTRMHHTRNLREYSFAEAVESKLV